MWKEDNSTLVPLSKGVGNRKIVIFLAKLIFGIFLLLLLIIWKDNGRKVLDILSNFNWQYLIGLLSLALMMIWVSCLKWSIFIRERGIHVSIIRLIRLYIIGYFFNNYFPSMEGGDFSRIYLLGNQINSKSKSAASVFLERFTGLIALLVLALIFSLLNLSLLTNPVIGISIGFVFFICLVILIFLFFPCLRNTLSNKLESMRIFHDLSSKIKLLYDDITFFSKRRKLLFSAMNYSFIFHFLSCVNVYLCCLSLGFHPPFLNIAVVTPIILLLNNIPVSFNNIGWWEWSFSVLLIGAGGGTELGLAVALALRGITFILSTVGGLLFLFERIS